MSPTLAKPSGLVKRLRTTCANARVCPFVNWAITLPSLVHADTIQRAGRIPFWVWLCTPDAAPNCVSDARFTVTVCGVVAPFVNVAVMVWVPPQ